MSEETPIVISALMAKEYESSEAGLLGVGRRLANDLNTAHITIACGTADGALANKLAEYSENVRMVDSADLSS
ncbi:MAG: hypothetical protein O7C75_13750, partial [Verrucomicrobia bacterium]|nr:hypothetical protein [Verrucomicrobiota bacterium]